MMDDKSDIIELSFQFTQKEFVRMARKFHAASGFRNIWIGVVCIIIIAVVSIFHRDVFLGIIVSFFAGFYAAGIFVFFRTPVTNFQKSYRYREIWSLMFSRNEVCINIKSAKTISKWRDYIGLWESKEFFYLMQVPHLYTSIPKRAFASEEEMQTFRDFAISNSIPIKQI